MTPVFLFSVGVFVAYLLGFDKGQTNGMKEAIRRLEKAGCLVPFWRLRWSIYFSEQKKAAGKK